MGGHGGAVVFVIAAVLIREEDNIESPSYHLGDGVGRLGETKWGGKLRCDWEG